jgi:hypothetical protein
MYFVQVALQLLGRVLPVLGSFIIHFLGLPVHLCDPLNPIIGFRLMLHELL